MERIAIERLDDTRYEIARNAITALHYHGSAAAERALWTRFETWHATWKDRVAELTVADRGPQTDPDVEFERSLVAALSHGQGWDGE